MPITCPTCKTRNVRISQMQGISERFWRIFGIYPLRCHECNTRFSEGIWDIAALRYARCPKCYRMDLSTWTEKYYNAPSRFLMLIRLGGSRLRCEYCRCNFVSFRPRKEKFSWKKNAAAAAAQSGSTKKVEVG